jgi:polyferredoxin
MKNKFLKYSLLIAGWFGSIHGLFAQAQQRFPKPEFESGYSQPQTTTPFPRALWLEYFDVFVLLAVLSLVSWFALKKRSRKGVFWSSVFSVLYFGFYREGCICSVGSIQNVTLALFDPTYAIPLSALLFFLIPLVFTLFFGRTFCAGACPLGAIQDLVALRPIELSRWVQKVFGLVPYLYLGLAVLYSATKSDFIICRYDPFVGFFRLDAQFIMLVLGVLFLAAGIFVARPYCRFFCPYGVLLGWMSRFSAKHLTITPKECVQCKLCAHSCPFGAIDGPVAEPAHRRKSVKHLMFVVALLPVWAILGGWAGSMVHVPLSRLNPTVSLAELIVKHPEVKEDQNNIDVRTFMSSGKTTDQLVAEASEIQRRFYRGSWLVGGFLGLAIGFSLTNLSIFRKRDDFEPNKANCLSCARCLDFCPVKK